MTDIEKLEKRVRDLEFAVNILMATHPKQKEIARSWNLDFLGTELPKDVQHDIAYIGR